MMLGEVVFVKVAAIFDIELAHLAVREFDAAHIQGDDPGAALEGEVAVHFRADGANDGNFVANGFDVLVFVFHRPPGTLSSGLQAGLPRPQHDHIVSHVEERLQNAAAQSLPIGEKDDHRGQAPNNAEHG